MSWSLEVNLAENKTKIKTNVIIAWLIDSLTSRAFERVGSYHTRPENRANNFEKVYPKSFESFWLANARSARTTQSWKISKARKLLTSTDELFSSVFASWGFVCIQASLVLRRGFGSGSALVTSFTVNKAKSASLANKALLFVEALHLIAPCFGVFSSSIPLPNHWSISRGAKSIFTVWQAALHAAFWEVRAQMTSLDVILCKGNKSSFRSRLTLGARTIALCAHCRATHSKARFVSKSRNLHKFKFQCNQYVNSVKTVKSLICKSVQKSEFSCLAKKKSCEGGICNSKNKCHQEQAFVLCKRWAKGVLTIYWSYTRCLFGKQ